MTEPSFAGVVGDLSDRLTGVASAAADVLSDAATKTERGAFDAKDAVTTLANLVALWVAGWSELLALPREILLPGNDDVKPITTAFDLTQRLGVKPALALVAPLRNGFAVEMPSGAVKLVQDSATETTEFTIEVTPPLALTGVFRGTVCATWPTTATELIDVAIQVP